MKKTILTKFWIKSDGTKIPLPLMTDEHIKNAYRRCNEILHGNHFVVEQNGSRSSYKKESPLSTEEATEWKKLFEEISKIRGIRLPKVDKDTYAYRAGNVMLRRGYQKNKNKRFDKIFE